MGQAKKVFNRESLASVRSDRRGFTVCTINESNNQPLSAEIRSRFFNMRYLGLSGRKGSIISETTAGTAVSSRRYGHPSSVPRNRQKHRQIKNMFTTNVSHLDGAAGLQYTCAEYWIIQVWAIVFHAKSNIIIMYRRRCVCQASVPDQYKHVYNKSESDTVRHCVSTCLTAWLVSYVSRSNLLLNGCYTLHMHAHVMHLFLHTNSTTSILGII